MSGGQSTQTPDELVREALLQMAEYLRRVQPRAGPYHNDVYSSTAHDLLARRMRLYGDYVEFPGSRPDEHRLFISFIREEYSARPESQQEYQHMESVMRALASRCQARTSSSEVDWIKVGFVSSPFVWLYYLVRFFFTGMAGIFKRDNVVRAIVIVLAACLLAYFMIVNLKVQVASAIGAGIALGAFMGNLWPAKLRSG